MKAYCIQLPCFRANPTKQCFLSPRCSLLICFFSIYIWHSSPHISITFSSFVKGHRFGEQGPCSFRRQGVIFQTLIGLSCWATSLACRSPHRPLHSAVFSEPRVPKLPGLTLTSGKPSWKSFFWNFCTSLYTFQITNEEYLGEKKEMNSSQKFTLDWFIGWPLCTFLTNLLLKTGLSIPIHHMWPH